MVVASITDTYFVRNLQWKKNCNPYVILMYVNYFVILFAAKNIFAIVYRSIWKSVAILWANLHFYTQFLSWKLKMLPISLQSFLQRSKSNKGRGLSRNRCCIQTRWTIFLLFAINLSCIKWVLRVGSNAIIRRLRTFTLMGSSAR